MSTPHGAAALPAPPEGLDPVTLKCQCAELWAHPLLRLLTGDTLRPGGLALTTQLLDGLDLAPGARVLDIGCGAGASLAHLAERGLTPLGLDYAARLLAEAGAHGAVVRGDAERLPFVDGCLDAVLIECVLSTVPDKPGALARMRRALRAGGGLALSDMTQQRALPEPLAGVASWVACTGGALPTEGYARLVEEAGFRVEEVVDRSDALAQLVAKARRRFALLSGAAGAGLLDNLDPSVLPGGGLLPATDTASLLALGRQLLTQLSEAVEAGDLGYCTLRASSA